MKIPSSAKFFHDYVRVQNTGQFTVTFRLVSDADGPVAGAIIRILDTTLPDGFADVATDEHGAATYRVRLEDNESKRGLRFEVLGSSLSGFDVLRH